MFASRSTRSGREHGWDRWSRHFYKLSTGLAATKVNPVLGIIGKNIENKTEKTLQPSLCWQSFGGPKYFFCTFGGLKEISTWDQLRGITKKYHVCLEDNLKNTQYYKRGVLFLQPYSFTCHCLWHSQKTNQGAKGLKAWTSTAVLLSLLWCITHKQWLLVNNPARTGTCQRSIGTYISASVNILLIHTGRSGGAGYTGFCSHPWKCADTHEFLCQETWNEPGGARRQ